MGRYNIPEPDKKDVPCTSTEITHIGLNRDSTVHIGLKYYDANHECFSKWEKPELKELSKFVKKLSNYTWNQVMQQAGSKNGFNYTLHKDIKKLPKEPKALGLSEDTTFFELRVDGDKRVHGFRSKSIFFLIWLDRNHQIYPS